MANNNNLNTQAERINRQPVDILTYTNVAVFLRGVRIGVIQSLERNETRDLSPIQELGTENVVEIVPGNTKGGTLTVSRFALYANRFHQLLGAVDGINDNRTDPFENLYQQRIPFEIQLTQSTPAGTTVTKTFVDCWLSNYTESYTVGTITINESCSIGYARVV